MKLKSQHIINSGLFNEICQPKRIIELNEIGSLLFYHTYYLYKPGTFLSRRTRMLTLYDKKTSLLKNHIEIRYPVNDFAYYSQSNSLIISTGEYDGGYSYHGELLAWNLSTNSVCKLIGDNREFRKLYVEGNSVYVDVMPTDDQTEDDDIKQYKLPISNTTLTLSELNYKVVEETINDNFGLETSSSIEKTRDEFDTICSKIIAGYNHKYSANCIKLINENELLIGYNDSRVNKIDLITNNRYEIPVESDAHCHQIISHKENTWILNFLPVWPPNSYHYQYNKTGAINKLSIPNGLIYKTGDSYITKQIVPYADEEIHNDFLLDSNLKTIDEFNIGPYNAYQHHLELEDGEYVYFFQGIDDYKTTKNLVKYSLKNKNLTHVFEFSENLKIVYPNGIKIDDTIYFTCTVNSGHGETKLLSLNLSKLETAWHSKLEAPIIQFKKYDDKTLLFIDVKGNFGMIALPTGSITLLNSQLESINQRPISIDFRDKRMAIGFNSGTVEILNIE